MKEISKEHTVLVYYSILYLCLYSEVPIIRPPMILVESGLNGEQVSLMKPIYIETCILVLKQVVLITVCHDETFLFSMIL